MSHKKQKLKLKTLNPKFRVTLNVASFPDDAGTLTCLNSKDMFESECS